MVVKMHRSLSKGGENDKNIIKGRSLLRRATVNLQRRIISSQ